MSWFSKLLGKKDQQTKEIFQSLTFVPSRLGDATETSVTPGAKAGIEIRKIPPVKSTILSYGQDRSRGRGSDFQPSEYELSEIGIIEDSVSGHRLTAIKWDGNLKTVTFEELWLLAKTVSLPVMEQEREIIYQNLALKTRLQVLSGQIEEIGDIDVAYKEKICRVPYCKKPCVSKGVCETHRTQCRVRKELIVPIQGVWLSPERIIRHKVSKKGYNFLQKHGSTEVTKDHSLITLSDNRLQEFKPEEQQPLAKINFIAWQFGAQKYIDLGEYSSYGKTETQIVFDSALIIKGAKLRSWHSEIPRYIKGEALIKFCAILGAFVSEGSTKKSKFGGREAFRIANSNVTWLLELQAFFQEVFPHIPICLHQDRVSFLECSSKLIADLFTNMCGTKSGNKRFPDFIYQLPLECVQAFQSKLIDGDGHREIWGYSYTTKSLRLASQYSLLLKLQGVQTKFNYRFNHGQYYYTILTNVREKHQQCKTWLLPIEYRDEYVYDLEITNTHNFVDLAGQVLLHNTESVVHQAFTKKIGLMFKEGFDFVGSNKDRIQYIKTRFAQIARASEIPTNLLFTRLGTSLIRTSNAFAIKVRDTKASGGKIRKNARGKQLNPVAAYFPAAPETMQVKLNADTGKIEKWKQELPDGRYKEFNPDDVIHFTIGRREGFVFATPDIIPVIDDIRALRQIEENIELLLYQHLFPLFQYKVGTETRPAGWTEDGRREIDVVKEEIQYMPTEGGIVTPERHEITAVGAEGRALRAEGYLDYFKLRVIAGLGISTIDLGNAATANRACYSEDTQTLTDSGWKYHWEISPDDLVATVNPTTNLIEYQKPTYAYVYDYTGKMVLFRTQNVDVCVTPEHQMWLSSSHNKKKYIWKKKQASLIDGRSYFRVGGFGWQGSSANTFTLPYVPYRCHSEVPNPGPFAPIPIRDWLEFLGYYASEGTLAKVQGNWRVGLSQSASVNPRKRDCIRACLQRLPFKFSEYTDPTDHTTRFWIHCKSLYLYLEDQCGDYSYQKRLPAEILDLNTDLLEVVYRAALLGDGDRDPRPHRKNHGFTSSSDQLFDQMFEIALKLGYKVQETFAVRARHFIACHREVVSVKPCRISYVPYQGKVFCFEVPNGIFLTRRNGKVGLHGNSARTLSRQLIDSVKSIQDSFEAQIDQEMISELLEESTFTDDVLSSANMVHAVFKEIDIENKIEHEKHSLELFKGNALTYAELRAELGREPILLPEDPHDQDPTKYPEWHSIYWKLFEEPSLLIRAIDEAWSPQAKAAAEARSLQVTGSQLEQSAAEKKTADDEEAKRQAEVKKAAPPKPAVKKKDFQDHLLREQFTDLLEDLTQRLQQAFDNKQVFDPAQVKTSIKLWTDYIQDKFVKFCYTNYIDGVKRLVKVKHPSYSLLLQQGKVQIQFRLQRSITRFAKDLEQELLAKIDVFWQGGKLETKEQSLATIIRSVFEVLRYRLEFMTDVEPTRSFNLGYLMGLKVRGIQRVELNVASDACEDCQAQPYIDLSSVSIEHIVPRHAACRCTIRSPF